MIGEGVRIDGDVSAEGELIIAGEVRGNVEADQVIVRGTVVGNVKARRAVRLEAGARMKGDVEAPALAVVPGAEFSGALKVIPSYEPESVARTEVIMRPVHDDRSKKRVVVKKRP
jgi:cytoskeletal protein CcmA (bactofilin family)